MQRASAKAVRSRAATVSSMLKDGLRVAVEREPNFGVIDVVLYDRHGSVRVLDEDVSAREAYLILGGMIEALRIIGREPAIHVLD